MAPEPQTHGPSSPGLAFRVGALSPVASPLPCTETQQQQYPRGLCFSTHLCLTWELPAGPLPGGRKGLRGNSLQPLLLLTSIFLPFALFFHEALNSFEGLSGSRALLLFVLLTG